MADIQCAYSQSVSQEIAKMGDREPRELKAGSIERDCEASLPEETDGKSEEYDPWALPAFKSAGPEWSELDTAGKFKRVVWTFTKLVLLLFLLYMFICSLSFLSSAFRLLGGKAAGEAFASNKLLANPVAGLMIGLLGTVLVQSSSTTTSIVVAMVAASIIEVRPAIPIVMGANIGTSVTNTLVSMAQAADKDQFRRAFAGAVVHDIFNWLSVLVFLPLEVVTHYLFYITDRIVGVMNIKTDKGANKELLKKITKPFTKVIIQLDKKVIQNIALKVAGEENKSLIKTCSLKKTVLKNVTEFVNITGSMANQTVERNLTIKETVKCDFLFSNTGMSDTTVGVILLIIALFILCACLICVVKLLHSMLRGQLASVIKRTVNSDFPKPFHHLTGYFAIIVGSAMTILVQSSSIFTSALTPLIGVGVVSIERAYPLTLGANIGTTATGILAALASDSTSLKRALQIALCHLFFNISGILLWYPIPYMRRVPIRFAKFLGNTTAEYRWFALAYLVFGFFLLPASVFGLSLAGWQILLGVAIPILVLLLFILITNLLQSKRPSVLPDVLKDWEWAPKWTRSLEPHDKVMKKAYEMSKGRCGNKRTTQITKQQVETVV